MTLPNLLIIGAQKCGTTSLHNYLQLHPEVFMSGQKELDFFAGPGWNWERGRGWYESCFRAGERAPVRGESSASYSMHPWVTGVPQRIHSLVPDARLIYMVRDPIERMVSQYVHYAGRGYTRRSMTELFSVDRFSDSDYVSFSRYALQLEQYLHYFPLSRIMVVDQEELLRKRAVTLSGIFRFLGVDQRFTDDAFWVEHNITHDSLVQRSINRLGGRLSQQRFQALTKTVPGLAAVDARLRRPQSRPTLEPPLRERLAEYVRPDTERLRELTGKQFESWSV